MSCNGFNHQSKNEDFNVILYYLNNIANNIVY